MTEQEWLTSDNPAAMLAWYTGRSTEVMPTTPGSDRKLRLFACAVARMRGEDPSGVEACVEAGQPNHNFEDGLTRVAWRYWAVCQSPEAARRAAAVASAPWSAALLRDIVGNPFRPVQVFKPERGSQIRLRELWQEAGRPMDLEQFSDRPEVRRLIGSPSWLTHTVVSLAQACYDERGRECRRCGGRGWNFRRTPDDVGLGRVTIEVKCDYCHGTGRIENGTLDHVRLCILADALEEAGCTDADIFAHLRSPGPHVRGCHVVDLILGRN